MRALTPAQLLDLWEQGLALDPVWRAVSLLSAAEAKLSFAELAELPIGTRDSRLLELRASTFGPRLEGVAACTACGQWMELSLTASELLYQVVDEAQEALSLENGEYEVLFRLPTSRDLMVVAGEDEAAARARLLRRCLLEVRRRGKLAPAEDLPKPVAEAVVGRMSEADPHADIELAYACPSCEAQGKAPFDVATFFWREIDAWARRILLEVHVLASAYGWNEGEILALGSTRRQYYLSLVGA